MAYRSMRRSGGGGLSYRAGKALIRQAVRSGRRRVSGSRGKKIMGIPQNLLLIGAAVGVAYWQKDKIMAIFKKPA